MATLLAKVQLGDNRHVDALVLEYWLDTIGDLDLEDALAALKRFRRERPGVYLEPGHLLELAGTAPESPWVDRNREVAEVLARKQLAELDVTLEEYLADPVVRARADDAILDQRQLEQGDL